MSKGKHIHLFVVVVKIDDDSEVVIKTCGTFEEAVELADLCTDRINGSDSDDDAGYDDADDDDLDDDDSW